jgi:hypothetical protein
MSRNTRLLVKRDNGLPGSVLARLRTARWSAVLLSAQIAAEGRLGP